MKPFTSKHSIAAGSPLHVGDKKKSVQPNRGVVDKNPTSRLGAKNGYQSDYMKDMTGQLKEMLASGDPSRGKKFDDHMRPAPREEVSTDIAVSAAPR